MKNVQRMAFKVTLILLAILFNNNIHAVEGITSIDPKVCSVADVIRYNNQGKGIGMFEVAVKPEASTAFNVFWALRNPKNKKEIYFGRDGLSRQSQVFRGSGNIECYRCVGSTGFVLQDITTDTCPDPLNVNYCFHCNTKVPCNDVVTLSRCMPAGADERAQDADSVIKRLDLVEAAMPAIKKG